LKIDVFLASEHKGTRVACLCITQFVVKAARPPELATVFGYVKKPAGNATEQTAFFGVSALLRFIYYLDAKAEVLPLEAVQFVILVHQERVRIPGSYILG